VERGLWNEPVRTPFTHATPLRERLDGVITARPRRGPLARAVTAALVLVLASVLVVTSAGLIAVALFVREDAAGAGPGAGPPVVAGAAGGATPARPAPGSGPSGPGVHQRAAPVDAARVVAEVDAAAAAAGGSIAVVVSAPDGRPLVSGPTAGDVVYSASLVKVLLVGRLLALEAAGAVALTDRDRALMERAVVRSDDPATSVLWDRFDGAALVTAAAAEAGLAATAPPAVAGRWGEATTSAADVGVLLSRLAALVGSGPAATLLGWMRATSATGADGFGQHFGLLAGTDGTVAAKQGWMCCVDGSRQLHSAGVLPGGQVVVLLGDFPVSTSWARARAALDAAAVAVRAAVG
jgi:hypothetical protein